MTLLFAPEAERDLQEIVDYLATSSPHAAATFGDKVFAAVDRLASGGFDGPEHTLLTGDVVRSWPVPPVRIYYRRKPGKALWIARIYHQARQPIAR